MLPKSTLSLDYPKFEEFGAAPCSEVDPEIFFAEDRLPSAPSASKPIYRHEQEAKATCIRCPYRMDCLDYALKNEDLQGIWGGTTEQDRRKLLRNRRARLL
jgi:WhiB family redox-sensing transcriptional regulator